MRYLYYLIATILFLSGCSFSAPDGASQYRAFAPDGVSFVVADSSWNVDGRGNHRAIVEVAKAGQEA
ncbi:MAG: hypothetical protein LBR18_00255, partial [Tannerella sp.]|nr:hypothetical protein [Tannerella sp.]